MTYLGIAIWLSSFVVKDAPVFQPTYVLPVKAIDMVIVAAGRFEVGYGSAVVHENGQARLAGINIRCGFVASIVEGNFFCMGKGNHEQKE